MSHKFSVIIPAYNEEAGIKSTLDELINYPGMEEAEIIVVDDGSTDRTREIVSNIGKRVRLLKHNINKGYGSSIITGAKMASHDIIAWYDADGQHRPGDLLKLINEMYSDDFDYCIGVRNKESYRVKSRVMGMFILRLVINWMSKAGKTDFNSGMRAFKKSVLLRIIHLLPERFGASTVTTMLMQDLNYYGGQISITVRKREGTSSVRQIRDGFRTIALAWNIILLFRAMQFFTPLGLIFIIPGCFYGLHEALVYGEGFPVLASVFIIFGFQILLFGITIMQISKIRKDMIMR